MSKEKEKEKEKEILIVVSKVKPILLASPGVKTISAEALAWLSDVVERAAENLGKSGRKTPGGRLMAPKIGPDLALSHLDVEAAQDGVFVDPQPTKLQPVPQSNIYETIAELVTGASPGALAGIKQTNPEMYGKVKAGVLSMNYLAPQRDADETGTVWSEYNDWQSAVRAGATKLSFAEWSNRKKDLEETHGKAKT